MIETKKLKASTDKHYQKADAEADNRRSLLEEMQRLEEARRKFDPKLEFDVDGKVKEPDVPEGSAEFFWREYPTQCAMCGKKRTHKRGYLFTGMTPEGEMKIFCNVNCCDQWEMLGDNTNARRAAIRAQKARKKEQL
jgi:hypothetical protein